MSDLTKRQRSVLEFIDEYAREHGYPPSVRDICRGLGLSSSATVHNHLRTLERKGYLTRDPSRPRAIEVHFDSASGAQTERRPVRHVPLVGDVAAGTGVLAAENVEEVHPLPDDLVGEGELFMLRVRGDSMIESGILDGDLAVVRQQPTAENGDIVVAGIPDEEATVKEFRSKGDRVVLRPHNSDMTDLVYPADQIELYGKVVTILRRL